MEVSLIKDKLTSKELAPVIFGFESTKLNTLEIEFFKKVKPVGYILFKRNIADNAHDLCDLTRSLYEIDASYQPLILIDQEGGRVERIKPPLIESLPAASHFLEVASDVAEAAENCFIASLNQSIALKVFGINTNCAPVLDVHFDYAHEVIGDRAYSDNSKLVEIMAMEVIKAQKQAGINGIIKHIPGHGRAECDSHLSLPVVANSLAELEEVDFKVFKHLAPFTDLAMTAHIIYKALDPENTATLSKTVIDYIRNEIGFKGLLMTDDISMKALEGNLDELSSRALIAGCDIILHCNGNMEEMQLVADGLDIV